MPRLEKGLESARFAHSNMSGAFVQGIVAGNPIPISITPHCYCSRFLPKTVAHYLMIGHTLMSISSAHGAWTITTLRTWGYGQKGSDPLRRISLYPGSTLGESSWPSTTYRQMILSTTLRGGSCGGKNASAIVGY
jgi:hypothetical protein